MTAAGSLRSQAAMRRYLSVLIVLAGFWQAADLAGPGAAGTFLPQRGGGRGRGGANARLSSFHTDVPDHAVEIILARPTATSITLSAMFVRDTRALVAYGTRKGAWSGRTDPADFMAGSPGSIVISQLKPDTGYFYGLVPVDADGKNREPVAAGSFHTQRTPGSPFVFTVTADSHLDQRTDPALYRQTLTAALADGPDFHVDLGDTFMSEQHADRQSAARQYAAQRFNFGLIARSTPLFLVLGNHDGEGARFAGSADSLAVWASGMRKRYFPNPAPDEFYTGNTRPDPGAGLLEDYYAWRWGDGLFIVLDPFWYTAGRRDDAGWEWTLGREQYEWLARTLAQGRAAYTFVFVHHLVGGGGPQARGGAEASVFCEWGGANRDGTPGFSSRRPGWALPIHDLLAKYGATAVFHGHDHLYAHQERGGLTYQEVPQPGNPQGGAARNAVEYGYKSGTVLGGSGHLRVTVGSTSAAVEFVAERGPSQAPTVADRYVLAPSGRASSKKP
jgi:hypothetical protein